MGMLSGILGGSLGRPILAKVSTMDADLESIPIEFQRKKFQHIRMKPDCTGRQLFDLVCRIIGLREFWYFGLQYVNKKNISCWLQMDKKICKQDVPKGSDGHIRFLFLVKFYPEDVEEELIQDLTRHLFFIQIKQAILSQDLYCSAEAAVLLASYAVQAINGDCSDEKRVDVSKHLPANVTSQYDMSPEDWQERIRRWWTHNAGQSREDSEMEYLRVAQDLEMYGIQYYPIRNKKETDLQLGVSAQGIGIYKGANRITPRPFFSWSEIKNISFKNKKFNMKTIDKSTISFQAQDHSINMSILELCIGTHNLYLRRRQPDMLEVQQMKAQAKEERVRKQEEQSRLQKEREDRMQVESERNQLKSDLQSLNEQLQSLQEQARKSEETAAIQSTKARTAAEEIRELIKRAEEAEQEAQRIKISHVQCDGVKRMMEETIREKEMVVQRLSMSIGELNRQSRPPGTHYTSQGFMSQDGQWMSDHGWTNQMGHSSVMSISHQELLGSGSNAEEEREREVIRQWEDLQRAHRSASTQPMIIHNSQMMTPRSPPPFSYLMGSHPQQSLQMSHEVISQQAHPTSLGIPQSLHLPSHHPAGAPPPDPSVFAPPPSLPSEIIQIRNKLDKSKLDYNQRTRHFKEALEEFRSELEGLKREERVTDIDRAHASKLGRDRHDTLRMRRSKSASSLDSPDLEWYSVSATGTTKRRVEAFEEL